MVALGVATVSRWRPGGVPRFVTLGLHRSVSLLAVAFLAVHVLTAVIDPDAAVRAVAVVVPLPSDRYALWLGLGALALDLVVALVVTSLLRQRIAPRAWRAVHWPPTSPGRSRSSTAPAWAPTRMRLDARRRRRLHRGLRRSRRAPPADGSAAARQAPRATAPARGAVSAAGADATAHRDAAAAAPARRALDPSLARTSRALRPHALAARRGRALIAEVEASGLRGRGGAGFPTHVKLRPSPPGARPWWSPTASRASRRATRTRCSCASIRTSCWTAQRRRPRPSARGRSSIARRPRTQSARTRAMAAAIAERARAGATRADRARRRSRALRRRRGERARQLAERRARKAHLRTARGRSSDGVGGRPTLVQNVETLANIALIARYGADWFRELGSDARARDRCSSPWAARCARPGVTELELGHDRCGPRSSAAAGSPSLPRRCSIGGYFGTWVPAAAALDARALGRRPAAARRRHSARARSRRSREPRCGLAETARIAAYLARESAGQCGPCVFGLEAIADALDSIAACDRDARATRSSACGASRRR